MRVLLIDNYDSFTFNLVHYLESFNFEVEVKRNDDVCQLDMDSASVCVISPGPGLPCEAGNLLEILKNNKNKAILGVCLGLQAMVEVTDSKIFNISEVRHGLSFDLENVSNHSIWQNIKQPISVGLYHSWATKRDLLNNDWTILAESQGLAMAIEHTSFPWIGLQFHPESILTPQGKEILSNAIGCLVKKIRHFSK